MQRSGTRGTFSAGNGLGQGPQRRWTRNGGATFNQLGNTFSTRPSSMPSSTKHIMTFAIKFSFLTLREGSALEARHLWLAAAMRTAPLRPWCLRCGSIPLRNQECNFTAIPTIDDFACVTCYIFAAMPAGFVILTALHISSCVFFVKLQVSRQQLPQSTATVLSGTEGDRTRCCSGMHAKYDEKAYLFPPFVYHFPLFFCLLGSPYRISTIATSS